MKKEQTFEEIIYDMLLDLTKLECSIPFRTAVDPVTDGCPTYYEIVKEPMDLATLKV
jgi:transcription initiation factor TFIID subunit 2